MSLCPLTIAQTRLIDADICLVFLIYLFCGTEVYISFVFDAVGKGHG